MESRAARPSASFNSLHRKSNSLAVSQTTQTTLAKSDDKGATLLMEDWKKSTLPVLMS